MKISILVAILLFVVVPSAKATGWYDGDGYHFGDQPGDVCYERGGITDTFGIELEPEVINGVAVTVTQLWVVCGNGESFPVGIIYGVPADYFSEYIPPDPGVDPWVSLGMSECEYYEWLTQQRRK